MAIQFLKAVPWKHVGIFVAGSLFSTAGLEILGSKEAKKVYTEVTAAGLRCKDEVMKSVTAVQEGANDILADAKALNEERAAEDAVEEAAAVYEDLAEVEEAEEAPAPKKAPAKKPAAKKAPAKK